MEIVADSPLIGRTAVATHTVDKPPRVVAADCIVLKNVKADGKMFELALFKPADEMSAGFVGYAWTCIANGEPLNESDEDDLEACLDDCYYMGWFSKRQITY